MYDFINKLEEAGELVRIKESVSPELEIAEITDRIVKNDGKALLFENNGTSFPLLINALGSERRMCLALGVENLDELGSELEELFMSLLQQQDGMISKLKMLPKLGKISGWMPKKISRKGVCQEVVIKDPDLTKLPVMKCWPEDGGPFITFPVVHTKDPHDGSRNVGMYRMQVFSGKMTGMHWHLHKNSARHYREYKSLGKKMPISVALGGDPVYTYVATAPLPDHMDEYMLAGFLRKKRVELVKSVTNDIEVPADADIIIEGYVDPAEELVLEGPFGDHTGYYSLADMFPRFHVSCITHRKDAVYPSTIVGIPPQEDGWIGKATERLFLKPIKLTMVQEILDMNMPVEGVFHNIVISKIEKTFPGQAAKVMNSLWGAGQMMFNKIMIVAGKDTDIHDPVKLAQDISERFNPERDVYLGRGPLDILDHSSHEMAVGGKLGIDITNEVPIMDEDRRMHILTPGVIAGIRKTFREIIDVNTDLPRKGLAFMLLTIRKNRKNQVRELAGQLVNDFDLGGIKIIIMMEEKIDVYNIREVVWRFANNTDPARDCYVLSPETENRNAVLVIDATLKTPEYDDHHRDWPNIIASDDKTIKSVDEKWERLGLGKFITSPSIRYRKFMYGNGAVSKPEQET